MLWGHVEMPPNMPPDAPGCGGIFTDSLGHSIDPILSIYAGLVDFCGVCRKPVGGRERESNPPKAVSRPQPVLKTGRPTGDDALPRGRSHIVPKLELYSIFAQSMQIAKPAGVANPVKKFEDVDSQFTARAYPVAELGGRHRSVRRITGKFTE